MLSEQNLIAKIKAQHDASNKTIREDFIQTKDYFLQRFVLMEERRYAGYQ